MPEPPPKQRGMPELSGLHTAFMPLQQSWLALILPPSGSTGAPQMLPTGLHACPSEQRPPLHITEPFGFVPPPQQSCAPVHQVPVSRQPSAAWQTVVPEPGSVQKREQQLLPLLHGSPAWVQFPPPVPEGDMQRPTPPAVAEQE